MPNDLLGVLLNEEETMSQKYTPWFDIGDAMQRPRRPGVYQLLSPGGVPHYSRWDGKRWLFSDETPQAAARQQIASTGVRNGFYLKWRGLLTPNGRADRLAPERGNE